MGMKFKNKIDIYFGTLLQLFNYFFHVVKCKAVESLWS